MCKEGGEDGEAAQEALSFACRREDDLLKLIESVEYTVEKYCMLPESSLKYSVSW